MLYKKISALLFIVSIGILNAGAIKTIILPDVKDQKSVTIHTPKIAMAIDYSGKASITSLIVNGQKVIDNVDGVFTSLKINGVTYSSLHLKTVPVLTQTKDEWKLSGIKYGDANITINETW